ncbi:MAG: ankyrin repeat protein, partial [Burkholderiaceae bacterium]
MMAILRQVIVWNQIMKISTFASASFAAFAATKAVAFKPDPSHSNHQQKNSDSLNLKYRLKKLWANGNNNAGDLSEFLGNNNDPNALAAFKDVMNDDMDSLKKRLENGLNPDIKFFGGQTILHLIALKGKEKFLGDEQYLPIVRQLWLSGGNLDAVDDSGNTILDALGSNQGWGLGDSVDQIKNMEMNASFNQKEL